MFALAHLKSSPAMLRIDSSQGEIHIATPLSNSHKAQRRRRYEM